MPWAHKKLGAYDDPLFGFEACKRNILEKCSLAIEKVIVGPVFTILRRGQKVCVCLFKGASFEIRNTCNA